MMMPMTFTAVPSLPEFNQAALEQLEAMGFPLIRCQKALLATGNSDVEAAMEWLFAHLEDPGKALRTTKTVAQADELYR
jgi:ubiquitin carboxyl-terminal hydrolase 5/13